MKFEVVAVESGEVLVTYVPLFRGARESCLAQAKDAALFLSRKGRGGTKVEVRKLVVAREPETVVLLRAGREVSA